MASNTQEPDVKTYLRGRTIRWSPQTTAIPVFIQPFHWYEPHKKCQARLYHGLVLQAMSAWSQASADPTSDQKIRFKLSETPVRNGITVHWQRVNRNALGYCHWRQNDRHEITGADLQIGLTDGHLFARYDAPEEVYQVILHEFGHALGLDHSENPEDVMYGGGYVYGIRALSTNDLNTLRWLYRLPAGLDYPALGRQLGVEKPEFLDKVLQAVETEYLKEVNPSPPAEASCEMIDLQQYWLSLKGKLQLPSQIPALPMPKPMPDRRKADNPWTLFQAVKNQARPDQATVGGRSR